MPHEDLMSHCENVMSRLILHVNHLCRYHYRRQKGRRRLRRSNRSYCDFLRYSRMKILLSILGCHSILLNEFSMTSENGEQFRIRKRNDVNNLRNSRPRIWWWVLAHCLFKSWDMISFPGPIQNDQGFTWHVSGWITRSSNCQLWHTCLKVNCLACPEGQRFYNEEGVTSCGWLWAGFLSQFWTAFTHCYWAFKREVTWLYW